MRSQSRSRSREVDRRASSSRLRVGSRSRIKHLVIARIPPARRETVIAITRLSSGEQGGKSGARFGLKTVADVVPVNLFVRFPICKLAVNASPLGQKVVRPTGSPASFQTPT